MVKVAGEDTEADIQALSRDVCKLPAPLRRSLTWDRGLEMARYKEFTAATKVKVYFCDPQSPCQRGTNDTPIYYFDKYFPEEPMLPLSCKRSSTSSRLSQRPRKTLGFQTPVARLHTSVASTV